jgi:starch synthase
MKVLFVVSEVAPIIKLGGLGDVAGSLPKALQKQGVDVDIIVPFFPIAKTEGLQMYKKFDLEVFFGNNTYTVEVHNTKLPGTNVDVMLLKNAEFFSQGGTDAFANNISETEMFLFFSRAVVELIKSRFNTYDLVHCNDWHTGLITHLLHDELSSSRPATLFTIHNFLYQGVGDTGLVNEVGIAPGRHPALDWDISDGDINLMQEAITSADYINTVSPTYAMEILTQEFGGELSEILGDRSSRLSGILNGVDYSQLPRDFDVTNFPKLKFKRKRLLQQKLGLAGADKPLFSFISRLDPGQKGLEILYEAAEKILDLGGQFVLLGTGDPLWEGKFESFGSKMAESKDVSINIKFDTSLAIDIYAGSDFFVMPSKYEPCGLTQMMAMWYGTLPIVHGVGGLKDSVDDGVNGFVFDSYDMSSFGRAIERAFDKYADPERLSQMVSNAMKKDFSWDKSALEYKELYGRVLNMRKLAVELGQRIEEEEHV